jgi:hypothetical protein
MKQDVPIIKEEKKEIINEIEEVFIPDTSNSVHFINSDNLQNAVYNPQKLLSLFDDLMKNFRLYIPKFISTGPVMVTTKFSSEYNVKASLYLAFQKQVPILKE